MKKIILATFLFFFSGCSFHLSELTFRKNTYHNSPILYTQLKSSIAKWKGTPYVLGGTSKRGADCSGFTQSIFSEFRARIPRTTRAQLNAGTKILKKDLKAGDLVFFKTGRGPNGLHVGIYLSRNTFAHLSTKGGSKEASLDNPYWKPKFMGARRYKLRAK